MFTKWFGHRFVLLAVGIVLLVAGCAPQPQPAAPSAAQPAAGKAATQPAAAQPAAAPAPPEKQVLRVGLAAFIATIDPNEDGALTARAVHHLAFDRLIEVGDKGNEVPGLAISWENPDPKTWVLNLRKGVKFQDGQEFTAKDVKFVLERMIDPNAKSRNYTTWVRIVDKVEVLDDYKVAIHTKNVEGLLLRQLMGVGILPSKYFQEIGPEGFAKKPMATGQYWIKEWRQDEQLHLVLNENSWRKKPAIREVIFRNIKEDSSRVAALEAGEIDVAYALPTEQIERLKSKGLKIAVAPVAQTITIHLRGVVAGPVADKRVRQAMSYAIDTKAMAEQLTGGYGPRLEGQFSGPEAFGYNPDVKAYPYDPAKAKQLLKEAGYPDGFEVGFQCTSYRYYKDREVCTTIASYLAQVGIKAKIEYLEGAVYLKTIAAGQAAPMYIIGLNYGPHLDIDISFGQYMGWHSYALHDNKELNALYDKAVAERDPEKRRQLAQQMVALAREEALDLYVFQIPGVYGLNPKVDGIVFQPSWTMDLANARITQ